MNVKSQQLQQFYGELQQWYTENLYKMRYILEGTAKKMITGTFSDHLNHYTYFVE